MTQMECELTLIKIGEAIGEIVKLYDARINHVSLSVSGDGYISVDGIEWDTESHKIVTPDLLDASKYSDGSFRFGGQDDD